MPLFEYRCPACGLTEEHLHLGSQPAPATQTCSRCKKPSQKLEFPTRVALARSGMDNARAAIRPAVQDLFLPLRRDRRQAVDRA